MEITTTNGITVSVQTLYLPEQSSLAERRFFFVYFIGIENGSPHTVQLLRRHWLIFDSNGLLREVDDEGVVGLQPVIAPGERFEYNSYCILSTEIGKMHGSYLMLNTANQFSFRAKIPEFQLVSPQKMN